MENSSKPIFAALSSELHSPVSIIQQNIESLKMHCIHTDIDCSEETFSLAEEAIQNILGIVENFQFLNNSDQLKKNINPQWFSLHDLLIQIDKELRIFNLDTSRLKLLAMPRYLNIFLDKDLINRILFNLLSNALKFSAKKVELNISLIKNNLIFTVQDYGIGIPEIQLSEIFNPFVKGKNASKFPGTGIGLSIVARAVESLDGTISVHSEQDSVTEFQVVIPYNHSRATNYKPKNKKLIIRNKIHLNYD
jgi:signal transduction histidine kinase